MGGGCYGWAGTVFCGAQPARPTQLSVGKKEGSAETEDPSCKELISLFYHCVCIILSQWCFFLIFLAFFCLMSIKVMGNFGYCKPNKGIKIYFDWMLAWVLILHLRRKHKKG